MKPPLRLLAPCALVFALAAAPAAAWDIASDASPEAFHAFNQRFGGDVYHYPRHSAAPLGLIGFDIYAEASADRGFDSSAAGDALSGSLSGGAMTIGRVGVRKGLPGGIDIGVAYGAPLGGGTGLKLASADVQWALIHGGVLSPAVSLRFTGTKTLGSGNYDLRQGGAEIFISKGFTLLTPYVGAGVVSSRGRLNRIHGSTLQETDTQGIAYAGLTLSLLIPKITVEVERAETVQASVRVGVGL